MESAEHASIGDALQLKFASGTKSAAGLPLRAHPTSLTYGQGIALGGDFFGVVGGPISTTDDHKAAFLAAYGSLATNWNQIATILDIMQIEIDAVEKAIADKRQPSTVYAGMGDSLSKKWNVATGGGSEVTDWLPMGRYLNLAAENWDHFTGFAIIAYRAGHEIAMDKAAQIKGAGVSAEEAESRLEEAYAINAFADHFLTDLFSAGHMRAPRRELYQQVMTPIPGFSGSLGSLLCRSMHDEDSRNGLKVWNKAGESWTAFGDKRLFDDISKANQAMVFKASQASADDVWNAYEGKPSAYTALNFTPDLKRVADVTTKENFSPLFKVVDGVAARRNDVANRQDYSWTKDWWGWSTYALIYATHDYKHVTVSDLATGKKLGWLGCTAGNYAKVVQSESEAHGCVWSFEADDIYLRKETSGTAGQDRFLGIYNSNNADWGLGTSTGKRNPVILNPNYSISLKASPTQVLCIDGDSLKWSTTPKPEHVVTIDLPLEAG